MGWPTDAEVLSRTDAVLRPGPETVPPSWLAVTVKDSVDSTRTEFTAILAGRGFSPAQILAWASGPGHPLAVEQALFFFGAKVPLDLKDVEEQRGQFHSYLDRRDLLRTMTITDDAGNEILPEATVTLGGIGHGVLKNTPKELGTRFYDNKTRRFRSF